MPPLCRFHGSTLPQFGPGGNPDYDLAALDLKLRVQDEPAFETARELAGREGLFVGMSSGTAVAGALQVAKDAPAGSTIVVLLPDRGDRYLSTSIFRSFCGKCPP